MGKTSFRNPERGLPNLLSDEYIYAVDEVNDDRVLFVKHA